ncbi:uncharacterized protein LOC114714742 [Neltuma alba]|uniref:uncharacterized protein LOC114714742 n=1 Tax=Neltuma alba TaxID=207710 RepID=UPI0010A42D48|nr:uncharacterized protein LOC114714742 [Prosopis alba]
MNLLFWNCRGTGSKVLPGLIRELKKKYKIELCALFETKSSGDKAKQISKKLGFQHCEIVDAAGFRGGIWISWSNNSWSLSVLEVNSQYIHTVVENNGDKIFITAVYASPNITIRRSLWNKLQALNPGNNWPWFIGGDFNATLFSNERRSNAIRTTSVDRDFSNWVESLQLLDMGCSGPFYTWRGKGCESRIDRVLSNSKAKDVYTDAVVKNLPWYKSDHRPILLQLRPGILSKNFVHRPFRFNAPWVLHDDFSRLVKEKWDVNENWELNIEKFTKDLLEWSKTTYGHLGRRKSLLMGRLEGISRSILSSGESSALDQLQRKLWLELEEIILQEDLLWAQKAKSQWYALGDKNTKYFHSRANGRRRRNKIEAIQQENGEWTDNPTLIKRIATDFFVNLFHEEGGEGDIRSNHTTFP